MQCAFSARSLQTFSPDRLWSAKIHAGVRRASYPNARIFADHSRHCDLPRVSKPVISGKMSPAIAASRYARALGPRQQTPSLVRNWSVCDMDEWIPSQASGIARSRHSFPGMSSLAGGASDLHASAAMVSVLLSRQAGDLRNDCLTPVLDSKFPSHRGRSNGARWPSPCATGSLASSSRAVSVSKNVAVSD